MNDIEDDLEDGDGFDEITKARARQTIDEEFVASGRKLPRYKRKERCSPVTGPPIPKLVDRRWSDHLDDERGVIRKAQAGDNGARELIHRSFNKTCISVASQYNGPPYEDRLDAAIEGLFKALKGYDLGSNNGFYAYAIKFTEGAVVDLVHDWHQRGGKLETRAQREKRENGQGFRPHYAAYNGSENRFDADNHGAVNNPNADWGNEFKGWIAADDAEVQECDGSGVKFTDADWERIVVGRADPTSWPRSLPEPLKPISRERYQEDQAQAFRFDTAAHVRQRLSKRLARIGRNLGVPRDCIAVDENLHRYRKQAKSLDAIARTAFRCENPLPLREYLVEESPTPEQYQINAPTRGNAPPLGIVEYLAKREDLRAMRQLARIGRQKYAQELVTDHRRDATEAGYTIPPHHCESPAETNPGRAEYTIPVNTAATAVPSDTEWGTWRVIEARQIVDSYERRMTPLVVAVDNGDTYGEYKPDNAVLASGNLDRTARRHRGDVRQVSRASIQPHTKRDDPADAARRS